LWGGRSQDLSSVIAITEDLAQVISQFGAPALPPGWDKTPSGVPTGCLRVTFATIISALAHHHILDPAQMTKHTGLSSSLQPREEREVFFMHMTQGLVGVVVVVGVENCIVGVDPL